MKSNQKKDKKHKPKYTYQPSKIFWIATFSILVFLTITNPSPFAAALISGLWGVIFVFDLETRKKLEIDGGEK